MRILFATTHKHLPELHGGMEVNTDALAKELIPKKHSVAVLCGLAGVGWVGLKARLKINLLNNPSPRDQSLGYPVWRAWNPLTVLNKVVDIFKPNILILQGGANYNELLEISLNTGLPVFYYIHTQDRMLLNSNLSSKSNLFFLANSEFTKSMHLEKKFSDIIRPLITPSAYLTKSDRSKILFVNPSEHKGLDIANAMALARKDLEFLYACTSMAQYLSTSEKIKIPNVKVLPPTSDMRTIYCKAKLVLAPSICIETWGRIATEAHFNGIPVLASTQGGLPEAVGPGGLCVPADANLDVWLAALSELCDQKNRYENYCNAARAYSQRSGIQPEEIVNSFISALNSKL